MEDGLAASVRQLLQLLHEREKGSGRSLPSKQKVMVCKTEEFTKGRKS